MAKSAVVNRFVTDKEKYGIRSSVHSVDSSNKISNFVAESNNKNINKS